MSSVPLQVQFDPAAARFGASRSQKRREAKEEEHVAEALLAAQQNVLAVEPRR